MKKLVFLIAIILALFAFYLLANQNGSGSDTIFRAWVGGRDDERTIDLSAVDLDGTGYSDTLKFTSGLKDFTAKFGIVTSGSEDAVDINNRSENIDLAAEKWVLGGSMGFTIKGGAKDIHISGLVEGQGKETDVDIGNWSDQSDVWVENVTLDLYRLDGSPIRVRVLAGDVPTFAEESGPYQYVFPWPWLPGHDLIIKAFRGLRTIGFFQ